MFGVSLLTCDITDSSLCDSYLDGVVTQMEKQTPQQNTGQMIFQLTLYIPFCIVTYFFIIQKGINKIFKPKTP